MSHLDPRELEAMEHRHPDGLTTRELVAFLNARGVQFSEATLRRYVQLGLLPASRRVGLRGRNRGSRGIYPTATLRRVVAVKQLLERGYTLQEIGDSFLVLGGVAEQIGEEIERLLVRLLDRVDAHGGQVELNQAVAELGARAHRLVADLKELGRKVASLEPQRAGDRA